MPVATAEVILRKGGFVGSTIEHQRSMDRTMAEARAHIERLEYAGTSVGSGTVFLADQLNRSRGRFVRQWYAPVGGLWGSMILVSTFLSKTRMLLPLAVGIACCEAVRHHGLDHAEIRWINDVLVDNRKVAGILLEGLHGACSKEEYILLGFGINVNNSEFPEEIAGTAGSLQNCLGRPVDLQAFTCTFLAKLTWNLGLLGHAEDCFLYDETWSQSRRKHPLIERWCQLSRTIGRRVLFGFDVMTEPQYRALVTGISDDGGLELQLEDGSETLEHSGEIRYLS